MIVIEAITGKKPFKNFSLLQLYYPLIYLKSIIREKKPIRTIFIDITTTQNSEVYCFVEVHFRDDMFEFETGAVNQGNISGKDIMKREIANTPLSIQQIAEKVAY